MEVWTNGNELNEVMSYSKPLKKQDHHHNNGQAGRSPAAHIVLDLRSLIWGFGITSQSAARQSVLLKGDV